jgi:hypothetical protein
MTIVYRGDNAMQSEATSARRRKSDDDDLDLGPGLTFQAGRAAGSSGVLKILSARTMSSPMTTYGTITMSGRIQRQLYVLGQTLTHTRMNTYFDLIRYPTIELVHITYQSFQDDPRTHEHTIPTRQMTRAREDDEGIFLIE